MKWNGGGAFRVKGALGGLHPRIGRGRPSLGGRGGLCFIISIMHRALKTWSLHSGPLVRAQKGLLTWGMNGMERTICFSSFIPTLWGSSLITLTIE